MAHFFYRPIHATASCPTNKFLSHNTNNSDDINKDESADIGLIGDAKLTIQAINNEMKAQIGENGVGDPKEVKEEIAALNVVSQPAEL